MLCSQKITKKNTESREIRLEYNYSQFHFIFQVLQNMALSPHVRITNYKSKRTKKNQGDGFQHPNKSSNVTRSTHMGSIILPETLILPPSQTRRAPYIYEWSPSKSFQISRRVYFGWWNFNISWSPTLRKSTQKF